MDKEILEKYKKAGRIAAEVRDSCVKLLKPGARLLEIAEWIENEILKRRGEIAFPVNISINNIAAHFTPDWDDKRVLNDGDMVKVDIGVHVDGYIGDTALTVFIGESSEEEKKMIKVNQEVLEKVIKIIKPGTNLQEIGELIQTTVEQAGFKPIRNLTGHGLERFNLHAEPQILNIKNNLEYKLSEGQVIAIEPFVTNGSGIVEDSGQELIFAVFNPTPTRNVDARKITQFGIERLGLPFAKRWIINLFKMTDIRFRLALRELKIRNGIYVYPVLRDVEGCKVSQFEHTVIVLDKPIVTTKSNE